MKVILLALVLSLTGCAIPQEMKTHQKEERVALRQYQKAERQAYRANELNDTAKKAVLVTTAAKVAADLDVKKKEKILNDLINKG